MCDKMFDVISCCVLTCDTGRSNVDDKIVTESHNKRENMEIKEIFT